MTAQQETVVPSAPNYDDPHVISPDSPPDDQVDGPLDGAAAIQDWSVGYVKRHPLASLTTVGEQFVLGVRTLQYFFVDLVTGRFQWEEFVRQGAFMAGTAVLPTVLVALPISVTLSVQFAMLAGQVGATSLAGAASGLADHPPGRFDGRRHFDGLGRRIGDHRRPGLTNHA